MEREWQVINGFSLLSKKKDENINKYKAKLVAKGYNQTYRIDYQ